MNKYLSNTGIWRFVFLTIAEYSDHDDSKLRIRIYFEDRKCVIMDSGSEYSMINNLTRTNKFMAGLSRNIRNEMIKLLKRSSMKGVIHTTYCCGKLQSYNDYPAICENGNKYWYRCGVLHRDNDSPARVFANGDLEWYIDGRLHRENDLPAMVDADGDRAWFKHGKQHRDNDKPASIKSNGDRAWYKNGRRHRDGDMPAVRRSNGNKEWYKNGVLHRDGGNPAVISRNGDCEWYEDGRYISNKKPR